MALTREKSTCTKMWWMVLLIKLAFSKRHSSIPPSCLSIPSGSLIFPSVYSFSFRPYGSSCGLYLCLLEPFYIAMPIKHLERCIMSLVAAFKSFLRTCCLSHKTFHCGTLPGLRIPCSRAPSRATSWSRTTTLSLSNLVSISASLATMQKC